MQAPRTSSRFRLITLATSTLVALSLSACIVVPPRGGRGGGGGYHHHYTAAEVATPAPQVEVVGVAPGPGWFWISGYWQPAGGRNVWVGGHWSRR